MLTRRTSFLASIHEVDDEPEIFVTASYSVRPHNSVTLSATIVSPLRGLSNLDAPEESDVGEEGFPNASEGITWQKRTTPIGEVGKWINLTTGFSSSTGKCTYTISDVDYGDYGVYHVFVPGSIYQNVTYLGKYSGKVHLFDAELTDTGPFTGD